MFAGSDVHGATLGILGMGRIGQAHRAARRARLRHEGDLSQPLAARAPSSRPAARRATSSKDELLREADHLVLVRAVLAGSRTTRSARPSWR